MNNTQLKSFKDLLVWQKAVDLAVLMYSITEKFPKSELYGITNQMRRSAVSISSNIAEGFKRSHRKEKLQFYNIAYASTAELESQIEVSYKLNFFNNQDYQKLNSSVVEIGKMINGLIKSQNKPPKPYILNSVFFLVLLSSIFYILNPSLAQAASLYFSPSSGSYTVGSNFSVTVYVSSADQAMNAVSGAISFPVDKLEAVSVAKTGSIVSLWVQEPSFSQAAVNFEGIVLNPGYTGVAGKIITVNFKAKQAGNAPLVFSSGAILANDGQGTNILTGMGGGNYEIILKTAAPPAEKKPAPTLPSSAEEKAELAEVIGKPEITSPTHPDQAVWYNNNDIKFNWELPYGITGVSVLLNEKSDSDPGSVSDGLFSTKEYQDLEDGIWYLHLKLKDKSGWSEINHFKVQVDTTPPLPFKINIDTKEGAALPVLYFKTTDAVSGIDKYEIKISSLNGKNFIVEAEAVSFALPPLPPDEYTAIVKAIDRAGNEIMAYTDFTIEPIEVPATESYPREPEISKAVAPVFVKIGSWEFDYFTVFVILLVFTILVISFLAFWAGLMRSKLKKEADEAEQILHKSLIEFKKLFEEDLDSLIELEKETGRVKEKMAARESLKRKIDFMENKVLKEIKDIEDLLK
ncbi:four helix bundle protein [Patescibacteria group bacterium]|nr:four helix bundle protein [Patescibacteria group bacterium]